jgi:hypothetical protein
MRCEIAAISLRGMLRPTLPSGFSILDLHKCSSADDALEADRENGPLHPP